MNQELKNCETCKGTGIGCSEWCIDYSDLEDNMNRALIVKKHWLDLILSGQKTMELRHSNTKIRGKIGLIESGSGLIVGTCEIIDSYSLISALFEHHRNLHFVKTNYTPYNDTHAWIIKNAKRYDNPIPYKHPQGAIIWVKL